MNQLRLLQLACGGVFTFFIYAAIFLTRQEQSFQSRREDHVTGRRLRQVPANQTKECSYTWPTAPYLLHSKWHVHRTGHSMISVFTAFLDNRSWTVPSYTIRVFGVSTINKSQNVFCQVWEDTSKQPLVDRAILKKIGRGYTRKNVKHMEYLFTCLLPDSVTPKYVSLTLERCENSSIRLPVIQPERTEPLLSFGICVAVTYGHIPLARIVEWVELNRLLGVREINIYNSSISRTTRAVFESYVDDGIVVMRPAPPPIPDWDYWPKKLAVIAALNDCLYRNMFRYRYTIVTDLDEFIIPKTFQSYEALFLKINELHGVKNQPVTYLFRNEYFFLDLGKNDTKHSHLLTQDYTRRMPVSKHGYAVKAVMDPTRCIVLSNHNCIMATTDAGRRWTLDVNETVATNQHYKKCHFPAPKCDEMLQMFLVDNTTAKYDSQLLKRFKAKAEQLKTDLDLDIYSEDLN